MSKNEEGNEKKRKHEQLIIGIADEFATSDMIREILKDKTDDLRRKIIDDLGGCQENDSNELYQKAYAVANAMVLESHKELKKDNKELKKDNKELKKDNEALATSSFGRLFEIQDDNTSNNELREQRENLKLIKAMGASDSSHVNTTHEGANTTLATFELDPISYHDKSITLTGSVTLSVKNWPQNYSTEPEVQRSVGYVLEDAVAYINWILQKMTPPNSTHVPKLMARPEASLFSNKPDHLVVYDRTASLLPVLSVEVKKEHDKVFTSKTVAGQILDYIMVGKLTHGKYTFGVVTTFNQSQVVWMDDKTCNEAAESIGRLTKVKLEDLSRTIAGGNAGSPGDAAIGSPTAASASTTEPHSPAGRSSTVGDQNSQTPPSLVKVASTDSSESKVYIRELFVSQLCDKPNQLFTVFCNAIAASLRTEQKKLTITENFETLKKGTVVLRLRQPVGRERGHDWHQLEEDLNINGPWGFEDKSEFFVVEYLGVGITSRVWRAVVKPKKNKALGYSCVIKYWIQVYDPVSKETFTADKIKGDASKATEAEVENYQKIYGELFELEDRKSMVGRKYINHRWCVILPFFKPIPKEGREAALDGIEKVLKDKFYINGESYQFKECDRRWRHVGEWKDEIVLFDLADLLIKKKMSQEEHGLYVEEHLNELRERMS